MGEALNAGGESVEPRLCHSSYGRSVRRVTERNEARRIAANAARRRSCSPATRLRIAANIAKLPELLRPKDDAPQTGPRRRRRARWCVCAERQVGPHPPLLNSTFRPLYRPACELPVNTGCIEVSVPCAGYFAALCRRQAPALINPRSEMNNARHDQCRAVGRFGPRSTACGSCSAAGSSMDREPPSLSWSRIAPIS